MPILCVTLKSSREVMRPERVDDCFVKHVPTWRRLYFEIVFPGLLIAVAICIHAPGVQRGVLAPPPLWGNAALIGHVLVLAAGSLIVQLLLQRRTILRSPEHRAKQLERHSRRGDTPPHWCRASS